MLRSLSTALVLLAAAPASATIDAWLDVTVPMEHPHTQDVCLRSHTNMASFGVPWVSMMDALLAPQHAWHQATGTHEDVNLVTAGAAARLVGRYVADGYDEATGVWSYDMELDVAALAAANGDGVEGRADTIRRAKLFLVAMADTMGAAAKRGYRLKVRFVGLPRQDDLPGTRLYASTTWAYGPRSSLLAAYRQELVDRQGSCRAP